MIQTYALFFQPAVNEFQMIVNDLLMTNLHP